jgi:hypothetical protein
LLRIPPTGAHSLQLLTRSMPNGLVRWPLAHS